MPLKVGDTCWSIHVSEERKVEFWEYHLRTVRAVKGTTIKKGHWFPKLPGVTWGKVSSKHGDYGWLPNIAAFRVSKRIEAGRPYATTKAGALREEIAYRRKVLREERDQEIFEEISGELAALLRAQKRMKGLTK